MARRISEIDGRKIWDGEGGKNGGREGGWWIFSFKDKRWRWRKSSNGLSGGSEYEKT